MAVNTVVPDRTSEPGNGARPAETLHVRGHHPLAGSTRTSGFKHSLVTVVAAAATGTATVRVTNCPDIAEARVLTELLAGLGAVAHRAGDTLTLNAAALRGQPAAESAERIHGAVYLAPALLHHTGRAVLPSAGGCRIGDGPTMGRPVEQYVDVLRRFGAEVHQRADGRFEARAGRLHGADVDLLDYTTDPVLRTGPLYSGATKMALLTAAVAHGTTTLRNLYPKPDVTDLLQILGDLGGDVERQPDGTVVIRGNGGQDLHRDTEHPLLDDLIEIVTWICAGATMAADSLRIDGTDLPRALRALAPELAVLERMGVRLDVGPTSVTVHRAEVLRPFDLVAASHGVYSDCQPFFVLLAALADGTSRITDRVWRRRFTFAPGLAELGMRLEQDDSPSGATLRIHGPRRPATAGRTIAAADLRAAAVLLLAALQVPGRTTITGAHHLVRGYADLPADLRRLGADITTTTEG